MATAAPDRRGPARRPTRSSPDPHATGACAGRPCGGQRSADAWCNATTILSRPGGIVGNGAKQRAERAVASLPDIRRVRSAGRRPPRARHPHRSRVCHRDRSRWLHRRATGDDLVVAGVELFHHPSPLGERHHAGVQPLRRSARAPTAPARRRPRRPESDERSPPRDCVLSRRAVKLSEGASGSCTCTRSKSAPSISFSSREVISTGSPRLATPPLSRTGKLNPSGPPGMPWSRPSGPLSEPGRSRQCGRRPCCGSRPGGATTWPRVRWNSARVRESVLGFVGGRHHHRQMPRALSARARSATCWLTALGVVHENGVTSAM